MVVLHLRSNLDSCRVVHVCPVDVIDPHWPRRPKKVAVQVGDVGGERRRKQSGSARRGHPKQRRRGPDSDDEFEG